jgi:thiol-disulfide isomerase/thioredoxin
MAESTSRQQRRAAEREKAKRLQSKPQGSKTPVLVAATICALLLLAIVSLVAVKLSQGSSTNTSTRTTAATAVVKSVTTVPASTFNAVGYQASVALPNPISGKPLTSSGKPVVIYVGAEYCPYCAAQRWPMVTALARFGTFTNLGSTHSSSIDVFPSTPTFTFHGSTYSSRYVVLSAAETASNKVVNNQYAPLDKPTAEQIAAYNRYNPKGQIPFTDFGGAYMLVGASYNPGLLKGLTPTQIAAQMRDPGTDVSKAILGTANGLTAAICSQTGGKPANVCSSPGVTAAAAHLGK